MNRILTATGELDWDRVDALVAGNYISARTHRTAPYTIYNYTPKTTFGRAWEEATIVCRGLIVDQARNIISRPFRKFWNLGENGTDWPIDESFEVYEKLDGSLGISYRTPDGAWYVATRGSFRSEQAIEGSNLLNSKYGTAVPQLDPLLTYLWEIIIPQNRIVVDYGQQRELVLLAVLDTMTGEELPLDDFGYLGFPLVRRYDGMTQASLQLGQLDENTNREGYVVRFASGVRAKIKLAEYSRIHRLVTQVTPRRIWEILERGDDIMPLVAKCPPGYQTWVRQHADKLLAEYQAVERRVKNAYGRVVHTVGTPDVDARELRKRQAAVAVPLLPNTLERAMVFNMLDGFDYTPLIWKAIYPLAADPYKVEV